MHPASSRLDRDDVRVALAVAESGTISGAAITLHGSIQRCRDGCSAWRTGWGHDSSSECPPASGRRPRVKSRELALRLGDDIAALERHVGGRDKGYAGTVRLTAPDAVAEYLLPNVLRALRQRSTHLLPRSGRPQA